MQKLPNQNQCDLSVIVPVSNMAGRLESFSKWIRETSEYPIEVIVVHDKCDNETGIELKKLLDFIGNPRIFLLDGKYNGPGGARNAGLKLASAEWISFWDSDDSINLELVFSNLRSLADSSAEIIIGGYTVVNLTNGKNSKLEISLEKSKALLAVALNPGLWRMQFRRHLINNIKFHELYMGEDQLFLVDLQIWSKKIAFVNNSGYTYHKNRLGQLTLNKAKVNDLILATKILSEEFFQSPSKLELYDLIILVRQNVTILIHAKFWIKLTSIKLLVKLSFKGILTRNRGFFKAIYLVLRYGITI